MSSLPNKATWQNGGDDSVAPVLKTKRDALAALGSGSSLRSDDERREYFAAFTPLQRDITTLMNHPQDIAQLDAKLTPLQEALDLARSAEADIVKRLADAPDWRNAEREEREGLRRDTVSLQASLKALRVGVAYIDGVPLLPEALRVALTTVCTHCQHETLIWQGAIPSLVERIVELDTKRSALRQQLDEAMRDELPNKAISTDRETRETATMS